MRTLIVISSLTVRGVVGKGLDNQDIVVEERRLEKCLLRFSLHCITKPTSGLSFFLFFSRHLPAAVTISHIHFSIYA